MVGISGWSAHLCFLAQTQRKASMSARYLPSGLQMFMMFHSITSDLRINRHQSKAYSTLLHLSMRVLRRQKYPSPWPGLCEGTFKHPRPSLAMKKRRQIGTEMLDLPQGRQDTRMLRRYRLMVLIGTSLALFLTLAGCGLNNRGTAASPADSAGTVLPLSPHSNASASGDAVLLRVDGLLPSGNDPISITLLNRSNQTLVFPDHLTACSTILLQVMPPGGGSGQWQEVAPCRRAIQTRLHTLAPGQNLTVTLTPPGSQWEPGLYRAALTYSLSAASSTSKTVFSSSFSLGSFYRCRRTEIACLADP